MTQPDLPERATTSAVIFASFGGAAVAGGIVLTGTRTVLFALGGTFLFAASLAYFLSSEPYLQTMITESVYSDLAVNEATLVSECGLQNEFVYVPRSRDDPSVSLFVPKSDDYRLPSDEELNSLFIRSDYDQLQGVSLRPAGYTLFTKFESSFASNVSSSPEELATQLADAVVEWCELANNVTAYVEAEEGHAVFTIHDDVLGSPRSFDHVLQSFLAVGLAVGLDRPVTLRTASTTEDDGSDYTVVCYWSVEDQLDDRRASDDRGAVSSDVPKS